MQISNGSKCAMSDFKIGGAGVKKCAIYLFKYDTSRLLDRLERLSYRFVRLEESMKSIGCDMNRLENKLDCLQSGIRGIRCDIKDTMSFFSSRIRYSKEYTNTCCAFSFNRKRGNDKGSLY